MKPAKPKKLVANPAPSSTTWDAYAEAYAKRYKTQPVRDAKINGQLSQLVARLGADEAPAVAGFFLTHQNALYVRSLHPVDLLLRGAEKLHTEWVTGLRRHRAMFTQAVLDRCVPRQRHRADGVNGCQEPRFSGFLNAVLYFE